MKNGRSDEDVSNGMTVRRTTSPRRHAPAARRTTVEDRSDPRCFCSLHRMLRLMCCWRSRDNRTRNVPRAMSTTNMDIRSWDFDVFCKAAEAKGRVLEAVFMELLQAFDLFNLLKLDRDICREYIRSIEDNYEKNPYHNATHATDVLQAVGCILTKDILGFTPLEVLAMLLAAAVHDVRHPGLNNEYHEKTNSTLFKQFNTSTNEQMHIALAHELLCEDASRNMLGHLPEKDFGYMKELVRDIILQTDMARHDKLVDHFKQRFPMTNGRTIDGSSTKDRRLLMQMTVHCADISNPCRRWDICTKWSKLITEEMYAQGEIEKEEGLPISMGCDRQKTDMNTSQKNFLSRFVIPCFEAFESMFPSFGEMTRKQAELNKRHWEDEIRKSRAIDN